MGRAGSGAGSAGVQSPGSGGGRCHDEGVTDPSGGARPEAGISPAGRDRVIDTVRVSALGVVVLGHALAWDVSTDPPGSVADARPGLAWVTWVAQVLPLFFAVGAVGNLASWRRRPAFEAYARRRLVRLGAPALVYATFWTALLLPLAPFFPLAGMAGDYLGMLTWFLGVYATAVVATPWTARWAQRAPVLTLTVWFVSIVLVDVARFTVEPLLGWANIILVWCWIHQLGFHLPALRRQARGRLLAAAAVVLGLAILLVVPGPYDTALVTFSLDDANSNFTPPTAVLALYGLAQVLVLAAAYPWFERLLALPAVWRVVGPASLRAVGLYLWHIPWVVAVAGLVWVAGITSPPLSPAWLLLHAAGLVVILPMTWVTAGVAARADHALVHWATGLRGPRLPVTAFAVVMPAALLLATVTGYGTWGGIVFLGILPSSSLLSLALLAATFLALAAGGRGPRSELP